MSKEEVKSYEDVLKEEFESCENQEEKLNKIFNILCNQTYLIEHILNNLSPSLQKKILKEAGFKDLVMD